MTIMEAERGSSTIPSCSELSPKWSQSKLKVVLEFPLEMHAARAAIAITPLIPIERIASVLDNFF